MLHDQEVDVPFLADVVERADVRVVEGGDRPGLALEAGTRLGVGGQVVRQHLDGDLAIEPRVPRPVDLTHAARPQGGDDLVGSQASSGVQGHDLQSYHDHGERSREAAAARGRGREERGETLSRGRVKVHDPGSAVQPGTGVG